ncbi:MAG: TrmH family RNA methyltransferase [Candidatus Shapirobacteria bacterium]
MTKLNAKQLRVSLGTKKPEEIYANPLVFILDNVTDTYNIGSFFRLADALGAQKIYLTGQVVLPPNPKIHRASVGLWRWVPWEHHSSAVPVIKKLKKDNWQIIALEQTKNSKSYLDIKPRFPVALAVGHETEGVSTKILNQADEIINIPLYGVNRSLNVLVAASVVAYHLTSLIPLAST